MRTIPLLIGHPLAAALLILELTPRIAIRERVTAAKEDLEKIFSMLETMAQFRPAAKQALDNLKDLLRTTETQTTLAGMANGTEQNGQSSHAWTHQTDPALIDAATHADDGLFNFDVFGGGGLGGPLGADFTDFSDFDTFLAQQQSYLYPTLSCSNLFDANGFFQAQFTQSRPSSPRNGRD